MHDQGYEPNWAMYSAFAFAFLSTAHSALYCAHDLGSGVGSVSSAFVLLVFWVPVVSDLASLTLRSIEFLSLVEALSVCSCESDSLAVCTSENRGGLRCLPRNPWRRESLDFHRYMWCVADCVILDVVEAVIVKGMTWWFPDSSLQILAVTQPSTHASIVQYFISVMRSRDTACLLSSSLVFGIPEPSDMSALLALGLWKVGVSDALSVGAGSLVFAAVGSLVSVVVSLY